MEGGGIGVAAGSGEAAGIGVKGGIGVNSVVMQTPYQQFMKYFSR